jgi:hypothetical protein
MHHRDTEDTKNKRTAAPKYSGVKWMQIYADAERACTQAVRRGVAFRVLARTGVDTWNLDSVLRSERCDAWGCGGVLTRKLLNRLPELNDRSNPNGQNKGSGRRVFPHLLDAYNLRRRHASRATTRNATPLRSAWVHAHPLSA